MNCLCKNLIAVVAMVGLTGGPGAANAQDVMRVAQLALPAVVLLVGFDKNQEPIGQGTGFVIGAGLIATNAHMVEGIHFASVGFVGGNDVFKVEAVLGLDQKNDLAIILVPGIKGDDILRLGDSDLVQIGQPIIAVGNPIGLAGTVSDGIISAFRFVDGERVFQISAPISPGSSGGPILNMNGEVIGVATSGIPDGENLGFAVPVSYLQDILDTSPNPMTLASLANDENDNRNPLLFGNRNSVSAAVALEGVVLSDCTAGNSAASVAFSIRNKTSEQLGRVDILVILYGQDGKPEKSFQTTHLAGISDLLGPGREARVSQTLSCDAIHTAGWVQGDAVPKSVEFRVLDYSIGAVTEIDRTDILLR